MVHNNDGKVVRRVIVLLLVLFVAGTATASDRGLAGATRVSEASYRHFLDDVLYTHYGDDRALFAEYSGRYKTA